METIQPLLDALQGDGGFLLQAAAWMAALRTVFKPFSVQLEQFLNRAVEWVATSPEKDDDLLLRRLLESRAYRLLRFAVDMVASIKLPSVSALDPES